MTAGAYRKTGASPILKLCEKHVFFSRSCLHECSPLVLFSDRAKLETLDRRRKTTDWSKEGDVELSPCDIVSFYQRRANMPNFSVRKPFQAKNAQKHLFR